MPDSGDPGATPAVPGATPDSDQPIPPVIPQPPATGSADDLGDSGKAALDKERDARREAERQLKAAQKSLRELQDAAQAAKDAELSELERERKKRAESERRTAELELDLREQRLREAVLTAAQRVTDDPVLALALVDRSAIEWSPDGTTPTNVDTLLARIIEAHPKLARGAPDFGGGTRGATPAGTDMNAWIRQAAKRT
jgi:hypothetical protein